MHFLYLCFIIIFVSIVEAGEGTTDWTGRPSAEGREGFIDPPSLSFPASPFHLSLQASESDGVSTNNLTLPGGSVAPPMIVN